MKLQPRLARNGPCPCGSGRRYKQCCEGKLATAQKAAREHRSDIDALRKQVHEGQRALVDRVREQADLLIATFHAEHVNLFEGEPPGLDHPVFTELRDDWALWHRIGARERIHTLLQSKDVKVEEQFAADVSLWAGHREATDTGASLRCLFTGRIVPVTSRPPWLDEETACLGRVVHREGLSLLVSFARAMFGPVEQARLVADTRARWSEELGWPVGAKLTPEQVRAPQAIEGLLGTVAAFVDEET